MLPDEDIKRSDLQAEIKNALSKGTNSMFLIGLLVIAERIGVVEMRRIIGRASRATYDAAEEQAERECATKLPRFKTLLLLVSLLLPCCAARAQTSLPALTKWEVNLGWDAPASSPDPVAGYDVFRAPSGTTSFAEVNTSLLTATTYSDLTPQNGTYEYYVDSVDASGNLSAPSNTATVSIPNLPPVTITGVTT